MSHRPKPVREIYSDSARVNLDTLTRQLGERGVAAAKVESIIQEISKLYFDEVDRIAKDFDADMIAIEKSPSPLELFIDCISRYAASADSLPSQAISLLQEYVRTMQDWL